MEGTYDVVVVGGGVVGIAVARECVLRGVARVCVVEQARYPASLSSGGNSGLFHSGFDAPPGSVEARCISKANDRFEELLRTLPKDAPPFIDVKCGAVMVSHSEEEDRSLQAVKEKADKNGVRVFFLTQQQVREREPKISLNNFVRALCIPGERLVDPHAYPLFLLHQATARGCLLMTSTFMSSGTFDPSSRLWRLSLSSTAPPPPSSFPSSPPTDFTIQARFMFNCAGTFGDAVEDSLFSNDPSHVTPFRIIPRKGQFVVYKSPALPILQSIILPIPTERTKGILVSMTTFGHILVGPTAEDQRDRSIAVTEIRTIEGLMEKGKEILPDLATQRVLGTYAGLRPGTEHRDYQIRLITQSHYFCIGGIRSTGFTACLGIAEMVLSELKEKMPDLWSGFLLPEKEMNARNSRGQAVDFSDFAKTVKRYEGGGHKLHLLSRTAAL